MEKNINELISIVIPCYNSEQNLESLILEIVRVMEENYEYEIILVDDGSKDSTYTIINELAKRNTRIHGAKFSKNFGQHAALIAGYSMTKGDIIVGLNDDGEQDPVDIPKLVEKLKEGYDYVCAAHELKGHSFIQKLGSYVNNYCYIKLLGQPKGFYFSSYYAMNRFLINEIIKNKNPFLNINGLILSVTKNVADVSIPMYERKFGRSGYSLKKSLKLWLDTYTAYTILPLRLAYYFTIICFFAAFMLFIAYITNIESNTNLLIGSILSFFISMIFLVLAICGEYLGRIYMIVNGERQYIMKEKTGDKDVKNE